MINGPSCSKVGILFVSYGRTLKIAELWDGSSTGTQAAHVGPQKVCTVRAGLLAPDCHPGMLWVVTAQHQEVSVRWGLEPGSGFLS